MYASARCVLLFALVAALPGCAARTPRPEPEPLRAAAVVEVIEETVPSDWRAVITAGDRDRLQRAETAWAQGLAAAQPRYPTALRDEADLLDPAIALPRPAPPPGPYLCRVVKLGGAAAGYASFKPFDCYVEAEDQLLTIVKQTGSKRPAGRLWPDGETRLVFLGALGTDGADPPAYGDDPARDLAGYVERVAPFRWRLAVPWPQDGGTIDIYELIPVPPAPGGPKPRG